MIPLQPYLPWKISITVLHVFAMFTTCLRLEHRRRIRRLWWDDYAAIVPTLTEVANIAILWLRITHTPASMGKKIFYSYASGFSWSTIQWWSRISLAAAVLRITPAYSKSRPLAIGMVATFIFFWVALYTALVTACETNKSWHTAKQIPVCGPASKVAIVSTVLDVLGDIGLIAIPLHQLWRIKRSSSERRLVRLVFSASFLTLLSSVALCIVSYGKFLVGPGASIVWLMACHVAEAVSIVTMNLLVLICWFRHYWPVNPEEVPMDVAGDIHITPHWSGQEPSSTQPAQVATLSFHVAVPEDSDTSYVGNSEVETKGVSNA